MACNAQLNLTQRFLTVRAFLAQSLLHWDLGLSYSAWAEAQLREQERLPPLVMQRLRRLQLAIPKQRVSRWEAFAVDGSQFVCPRTLKNQRAMGDLGKPDGMPQLSLTAILHLRTRLPWDFRVGPGIDSERSHLLMMLADLPRNSLLVADAGFAGYDFCLELSQRKQHFLLRVGGNIHLLDSLGYSWEVRGQTVYLWPNHQQNKNQPPLVLRLITVRDEEKQPIYLITSVLDPAELTDEEARQGYYERWGIEVKFRTVKQTMEHHKMRSRTPATCYLEMTWAFIGVWLLELMTAREVAAEGGDPRRISPAQARDCVRRVTSNQTPCDRRRDPFCRILADCQIDQYVRKNSKASRNFPRKKRHKPPKPPTIKSPTELQIRKAKQLTPVIMRE